MAEFIEYWGNTSNIFEDIRALRQIKSVSSSPSIELKTRRTYSLDTYSVRNSVCVAGNNRDTVMAVKKQVHRLLSGRCVVESFHFRSDDDIKDGALFVPKVILVAIFQPGRKLLDDERDEGQLDHAYDEVFQIGAELMVVYMDLPKLVYPFNTHHLYHPRLEQLVFPEQRLIKNLASHDLLLTITENNRKFNAVQEQRMLEWLLQPVDPKSHPVYRACAMFNDIMQRRQESEVRRQARLQKMSYGDYGVGRCNSSAYRNEGSPWSRQNETFEDDDEVFYNPHFLNLPESQRTLRENWNSNPNQQHRLEPSIHFRNPPSLSSTSSEEDDGDQVLVHGFMRSMESYPLLERSSRSRKKKNGTNTNKNSRKNSGKSNNGSRSAGCFYHYGSVVTEDCVNGVRHKDIVSVSTMS